MRTKTIQCDRCKKSETVKDGTADSNTSLKLLRVGTAVYDPFQTSGYYGSSVPQTWMQHTQEWCENCRKEIGLERRSTEEQKNKPYPKLEEQLAEIIRAFVAEQIPPQQ